MPLEGWEEHGISTSDLKPFSQPPYSDILANNTQIHFLGYYLYWDPQETIVANTGFSPNTRRSEGTTKICKLWH